MEQIIYFLKECHKHFGKSLSEITNFDQLLYPFPFIINQKIVEPLYLKYQIEKKVYNYKIKPYIGYDFKINDTPLQQSLIDEINCILTYDIYRM